MVLRGDANRAMHGIAGALGMFLNSQSWMVQAQARDPASAVFIDEECNGKSISWASKQASDARCSGLSSQLSASFAGCPTEFESEPMGRKHVQNITLGFLKTPALARAASRAVAPEATWV